jgi:predicted transposase/invertase (TIGR01784 family)
MQVRAESAYIARAIFYHDRLYTSQLEESESFKNIRKTISISIINFILLCEEEDLHNIYRYGNIKSGNELTDLKEMHFIELPKFDKGKSRIQMTKFEKWLYALKFGEHHKDDPDTLPDWLRTEEEIIMALHEMKKASSDPTVRELMEAREKALHDEATRLDDAEEKGKIEKGMEVAQRMKQKGYDIDTISEITGLLKEQIEKIL